jgi:hypothetical protein
VATRYDAMPEREDLGRDKQATQAVRDPDVQDS